MYVEIKKNSFYIETISKKLKKMKKNDKIK